MSSPRHPPARQQPRKGTSSHFAFLLLLTGCTSSSDSPPQTPPPTVTVRSFNVRYGAADDGEDRWETRADGLCQFLIDSPVDVLGLQEALDFQEERILDALADMRSISRGRDAGGGGERCSLLYRPDRFDVLDSGTFWLSESPEIEGSKSWDSSLPRIATWAELEVRAAPSAPRPRLLVVNTHFDHRGQEARLRSAQLLADWMQAERWSDVPKILLGDFNCEEASAPVQALLAAGLRDTYRVIAPDEREAGTFQGFRGGVAGRRIDYVFVGSLVDVEEAQIERPKTAAGREVSDHYPVRARLRLH